MRVTSARSAGVRENTSPVWPLVITATTPSCPASQLARRRRAGSSMRMPLVFAGLFVIGVMAMVMYEFFALLERRMTGWAHRGQAAGG